HGERDAPKHILPNAPPDYRRNGNRSYGNSISCDGILPKELYALGKTMNTEIGRKRHELHYSGVKNSSRVPISQGYVRYGSLTDIRKRIRDARFTPQRRTLLGVISMSAKCQ